MWFVESIHDLYFDFNNVSLFIKLTRKRFYSCTNVSIIVLYFCQLLISMILNTLRHLHDYASWRIIYSRLNKYCGFDGILFLQT